MAKIKIGINGIHFVFSILLICSRYLILQVYVFTRSDVLFYLFTLIFVFVFWWRIRKNRTFGGESCFAKRRRWACSCQWSFHYNRLHGTGFYCYNLKFNLYMIKCCCMYIYIIRWDDLNRLIKLNTMCLRWFNWDM